MLNAIPVFGWILSLVLLSSLAVPFWIAWTVCGIGATYFNFVPVVWQTPGFWACVGIFFVISILKAVLLPGFGSTVNCKGKEGSAR